jgi:hypothetical protein
MTNAEITRKLEKAAEREAKVLAYRTRTGSTIAAARVAIQAEGE